MHQIDHDPYHNYITEIIDFAGYMIIDTACQRSCCSSRWLDVHNRMLSNYHLKSHIVQSSDNFQFGSGGIHRALQRAYVPAALPGQPEDGLILGISVVPDAQIPFLASSSMLEKLGCIIDTVQKRLHFRFLGVDVPLEKTWPLCCQHHSVFRTCRTFSSLERHVSCH